MMKSVIAYILSAVTLMFIMYATVMWKKNDAISWDKSGYYLYLPAVFTYHDLGNLKFYPNICRQYRFNGDDTAYSIYKEPNTGRLLNKYPVGVSILELPFYEIASLYTHNTSTTEPADGYSKYYRQGIAFATFFWVMAGMWLLRKLLRRYFDDTIVAILLVLTLFATNLYNYTIFDAGMSHPFSFFLFSLLLYYTERFYTLKKAFYLIGIGATLGLITITRPTNILVAVIPLLWDNWIPIVKARMLSFAWAALAFLFFIAMQCSYWKYATGHWVHFSYENEGFNFLSPHIWDGLFSYRKGWFIYTPLALFSITGLIFFWKQNKRMAVAIIVYTIINIYVVFSWSNWWYGGGFGCRALIETYAILALPLGALLDWIIKRTKSISKVVAAVLFYSFVCLNMFQTYQFNHDAMIASDNMNKEQYWKIFGDTGR